MSRVTAENPLTETMRKQLAEISRRVTLSPELREAIRKANQVNMQSVMTDELRHSIERTLASTRVNLPDILRQLRAQAEDVSVKLTVNVHDTAAAVDSATVTVLSQPTSTNSRPSGFATNPVVISAATFTAVLDVVDRALGEDIRALAGEGALALMVMLTLWLLDQVRRSG